MKKRQFTPEYKAQIVLEILKEENTIGEIGSREDISGTQLQNWKKGIHRKCITHFRPDKGRT